MRISDWSSDVCSSDLPHVDHHGADPGADVALPARVVAERHQRGGGAAARHLALAFCDYPKSVQRAHPLDPGAAAVRRHVGCHGPLAARSEEHTSELQSLMRISYAVFCLNKKKTQHRP